MFSACVISTLSVCWSTQPQFQGRRIISCSGRTYRVLLPLDSRHTAAAGLSLFLVCPMHWTHFLKIDRRQLLALLSVVVSLDTCTRHQSSCVLTLDFLAVEQQCCDVCLTRCRDLMTRLSLSQVAHTPDNRMCAGVHDSGAVSQPPKVGSPQFWDGHVHKLWTGKSFPRGRFHMGFQNLCLSPCSVPSVYSHVSASFCSSNPFLLLSRLPPSS